MNWNLFALLCLLQDDADVKMLKASYNESEQRFVSCNGSAIYYVIKASADDLRRIYEACTDTSRTLVQGEQTYYVRDSYWERTKQKLESMGLTVSVGAL